MIGSKTKLFALAAAAAVIFTAGTATAQTVSVTADAVVQNTLTLTKNSDLNFGTITALGDDSNTQSATYHVNPDGSQDVPVNNGLAQIAVIDASAVTAADIDIADGAPGATINVVIENVSDLTDGTDTLLLTDFETSYNGGADVSRTENISFTRTFVGPTDSLLIGASVETSGDGPLGDGNYSGGFDVVFSY